MSFNIEIKDYSQSFKKTKFFLWQPGQHRFRLLGDEAPRIPSYWFGRGFIQANGFDDPQATLNRRIKLESPENFRSNPSWRPIQDRYYANVLDLTPVKMCPNCEAEVKATNGTFPAICDRCSVGVINDVEVKPLEQVRVLTGGKTLFEQIPAVEAKFKDENDESISITTYDCIMHVVGKGSTRSSVVLADTDAETELPKVYPLEVPPEDFYDLYSIVPKVTDDEMDKLLTGVSLGDIFAARKGTDENEDKDALEADSKEVEKKVEELFA